jgi:hypothetical protein
MFLCKFFSFLSFIVFFQTVSNADYFTPQEVLDYHQKAVLQWNVAQQAINDNPLLGNETALDIGCGISSSH